MITIHQALLSLRPNSSYIIRGDEFSGIEWMDESNDKPTEQEIEDEIVRLQTEYDDNEYQRLRQYPSIGDQLDMLWHAIDAGTLNKTSDFYTTLKAVKDANPKSE